MSAPPRVFVVDDHQLFRAGVRAEIGDSFELVGDASEVDAAVELIGERGPDVVLVDVHMPDGGGAAVIRRVTRSWPSRSPTTPATSSTRSGPEPVAT